jgi:hypothetical protein
VIGKGIWLILFQRQSSVCLNPRFEIDIAKENCPPLCVFDAHRCVADLDDVVRACALWPLRQLLSADWPNYFKSVCHDSGWMAEENSKDEGDEVCEYSSDTGLRN